MTGETLAQFGTTVASVLALVLSLLNLYLQRRDRHPRLRIRMRYEYRAGRSDAAPRIHDDSQEGLYLLLGDFLREHGLEYPQGSAIVRFALSNEGGRAVYVDSVRLVFHPGGPLSSKHLVFDPLEDRVLPLDLAGATANIVSGERDRRRPVELVPGDGVGYKFELVRLANTLKAEGYTDNIRLTLEARDRTGRIYRLPFKINTNLWAYSEDRNG